MTKCCICFDDLHDKACSFGCSHYMCSTCISEFLDDEFLKKRKSFLMVNCPVNKCTAKITESIINNYGSDGFKKHYQRVLKTIPPAGSNPTVLADFNYYYNDKGELRMIPENNRDEPQNFHFVSQYHYDILGDAIVKYIQQQVLMNHCGLKEILLPIGHKDARVTNNIFMSDDALTNPNKLLLLIQGSGPVRAGMWSRALCMNESLDTGSVAPYVDLFRSNGYGVIVFNPNLNYVIKPELVKPYSRDLCFDPTKPQLPPKSDYVLISNNSSPSEHTIYVWDQFISHAVAKDIVIVAHSAGGSCTMNLLRHRENDVLKKLRGIAFTDSVHSVEKFDPKRIQEFIVKNAINWVTSDKPLDTKVREGGLSGCLCLSAGHIKHESTNASAMHSVFKYLDEKIKKAQS